MSSEQVCDAMAAAKAPAEGTVEIGEAGELLERSPSEPVIVAAELPSKQPIEDR